MSAPFPPPLRHGRACPGHPDAVKRCVSIHRDHRHEAGDDVEGLREQRYVLTLFLTAGTSSAISLSIPARRGARSRGVAGVGREAVPPQVSHTCGRGRSTLGFVPAGPPEKNRVRRRFPALPLPPSSSSRAALSTLPRLTFGSGLPSPGPQGAGSLTP